MILLRVFIVSFFFISCEKKNVINEYNIYGRVVNCEDSLIYLKKNSFIDADNDSEIDIDTFCIKNGEFSFKGEYHKNQVVFLGFFGVKGEFPVVLEENVELILDCDSFYMPKVLKGNESIALSKYNRDVLGVRKNIGAFVIEKESLLKHAISIGNDKLADSLRRILSDKMWLIDSLALNKVKNEPDRYISMLLIEELYERKKVNKDFVQKWILKNKEKFLGYPVFDSIRNKVEEK